MEPVRLVFVRSSRERKERLPMCGVSSPWKGVLCRTRAVTRCRRRLHETPIQWQNDTLVVQLLARSPRGSESWALKASRAARSVSLPLALERFGLGEQEEEATQGQSAESKKMTNKNTRETGEHAAAIGRSTGACLSGLSLRGIQMVASFACIFIGS
ncbi:hypothetical protein PR202_gb23596 [Eleusine coracana subsp. coracana]|uniref:Uncharacterized protein n=1 Tax=Eleusine coracana subsp. coracana TaxID=191504 RepID=A0AAV5FKW5_ELECO|nr:hypothetical protein PR202_gb23596 [Eleusine coracana subsp. coracana]